MNNLRNISLAISFLFILGCGSSSSPKDNNITQKKEDNKTKEQTTKTEVEDNITKERDIPEIFKSFHVGVGGSSSFGFSSLSGDKIWVSIKSLILDGELQKHREYSKINEFNTTAFSTLQGHLKKSKFLIFWITKGWQESWFNSGDIQQLMDEGYIPVFNYWYFGDRLIASMPDVNQIEAYKTDNIRLADFLQKLDGEKMLIMEPEFNKKTVLDNPNEFITIVSDAIDIIKEKNPNLLFSISMMDKGSRGVNDHNPKCGYTNCALGDIYTWSQSERIVTGLVDKLDFISFHQMMGQFSRDYTNLGDWEHPNPRAYSDDELGIDFLAQRISNLSTYLNDTYNKPVFVPYIGIMSATWHDANNNDTIEDNEIDARGWEDKITSVYKSLSEQKSTLKESGLFGYAPMALFDNPRHDFNGYQYFMNNEYHLGIVGSSAKDVIDIASYGDLYFKGERILEYIYSD